MIEPCLCGDPACPRCFSQPLNPCPVCEGSGEILCPTCLDRSTACERCKGSGFVPCTLCGGSGERPVFDVEVEVEDTEEERLDYPEPDDEGHASPDRLTVQRANVPSAQEVGRMFREPVSPDPTAAREWREVDGVLGLHPVEPRAPLGSPPSLDANPFRCALPIFDGDQIPSVEALVDAAIVDAIRLAHEGCLDAASARARAALVCSGLDWCFGVQIYYLRDEPGPIRRFFETAVVVLVLGAIVFLFAWAMLDTDPICVGCP